MHDMLSSTNLIVGAFILILALIAAAASFLDRNALDPMRMTVASSDSQDTNSPESE
jgi:hypothetical protein